MAAAGKSEQIIFLGSTGLAAISLTIGQGQTGSPPTRHHTAESYMTKKSVIRPPSPFILSPGERKWLLAGSGFTDRCSANPVARFFKWTAITSRLTFHV
jgi:hypothetical protein